MDRAGWGEEEIKSRGVGSTTLVGRPGLELGAVNRRLNIPGAAGGARPGKRGRQVCEQHWLDVGAEGGSGT